MISAGGILQKQQYTHGLKHNVIIVPCSFVLVIPHGFHNSKVQQETIHTFEAIRRLYYWPKLYQDIMKYINKSDICAINLQIWPNTHKNI